MENQIPTLESRSWFRLLKVIGYIILGMGLLAPFFYGKKVTLESWLVDAGINFFVSGFILALSKRGIYYIVFGK